MEDKDLIKIDDLFRGRPDKEERVPAGAWKNMQDLLDKAATTGGGNGGGRYGMYALLALLTVGMGAGAVTWQKSSLRPAVEYAAQVQSNGPAAEAAGSHHDRSSIADGNDINGNEAGADIGHNDNARSAFKAERSNALADPTALIAINTKKNSVGINASPKIKDNGSSLAKPENRPAGREQRRADKAALETDAQVLMALQGTTNNSLADDKVNSATQNDLTSIADAALKQIDKAQFAPVDKRDAHYDAVVKTDDQKTKFILEKESDEWKKEIVDKVNQIDRKISYSQLEDGKVKQHIDTVANKTFYRNRLEPLSTKEKLNLLAIAAALPESMSLAKVEHTDATAAAASVKVNASAAANSGLVMLSDYKVKSSTSRQSLVTRFYDMMSQYLDGQKPYYFGANIGGQAMFSNPLQSGFHIGAGAYYEFKERYTLGVEFRYLRNSFGGGGQVRDNFSTFRDQVYNNGVYTALEQKNVNAYTLRSNAYLELPITIRYQLSKLSLMGGVYGNYMTGTRYTSELNKLSEERRVSANTQFMSGTGSITAEDFKARYGMGLTIGAGYDFSRKLSLDMRINQNIWTNMTQTSHLSENLYRATGVQLSLFYFIGKKEKLIYMMNQK